MAAEPGWTSVDDLFPFPDRSDLREPDPTANGVAPPDYLPPISSVSLEEFISVQEDSAAPLLGDEDDSLLTTEGFLLMYGDGGAGKTTLSLDALAHLGSGTPWLGNPVPNPVRTMLIENEGPRGPFRRKLEQKVAKWDGDNFTSNVRVLDEPWSQFTFDDPAYRLWLANDVATHEIDLIIVGPLASLGAAGTGTPDEVTAFMRMLADLRSHCTRPFAMWIVHHENKAGDVSGAWERVPDTLVHVTAQGNGRTRVAWRKVRWSSRLHNTTTNLLWDDGGFTVDEARIRDLWVELLEAFQNDDRWRTARESAGLIGANQDKVRDALMSLVEQGRMTVEIGPTGRRPNAKCWRLKTDSEALSHHESLDLLSGGSGELTQLTQRTNESVEAGHHHSSTTTDSDPPSRITYDDPEVIAMLEQYGLSENEPPPGDLHDQATDDLPI